MVLNDEKYMDDDIDLNRASHTEDFPSFLKESLKELVQYRENMHFNLMMGKKTNESINLCVTKMLSIMVLLRPKIEGGGSRTEAIKEEFQSYYHWIKEVQTMKMDKKEMDRIPDLYDLIVRAYDLLGLIEI